MLEDYKFLKINIFKIMTSPVLSCLLCKPDQKFQPMVAFPQKVPQDSCLHSQCTFFAQELQPNPLINSPELDKRMDRPCLWAKPSEMLISPFSESAPGQWNQKGEGESSWPDPEQLSSLITQLLSLECTLLHPAILISPIQPSIITTAHRLTDTPPPPAPTPHPLPISIHPPTLSSST